MDSIILYQTSFYAIMRTHSLCLTLLTSPHITRSTKRFRMFPRLLLPPGTQPTLSGLASRRQGEHPTSASPGMPHCGSGLGGCSPATTNGVERRTCQISVPRDNLRILEVQLDRLLTQTATSCAEMLDTKRAFAATPYLPAQFQSAQPSCLSIESNTPFRFQQLGLGARSSQDYVSKPVLCPNGFSSPNEYGPALEPRLPVPSASQPGHQPPHRRKHDTEGKTSRKRRFVCEKFLSFHLKKGQMSKQAHFTAKEHSKAMKLSHQELESLSSGICGDSLENA